MAKPWERAASPELVEALAALSPSALTALLVEVSDRRQRAIAAADVARRFAEDRFVRPSTVDQRFVAQLDAHLLAKIPVAYEAIELSPVAPLGACSALAVVHPNQVLPTFRSTEVVADCTNVLALICAHRRGLPGAGDVRLCTSHRVVRTALPKDPAHTQHFRMLTLARAGRDPGGRIFALDALTEHVNLWCALLTDLPDPLHAEVVGLVVAYDEAHAPVVAALRERVPVPVREDRERLVRSAYYRGIAYKLEVAAPSGAVIALGDGGFVDWVAKVRSDRKERLIIGAIGTELLAKGFARVSGAGSPRARRRTGPPSSPP